MEYYVVWTIYHSRDAIARVIYAFCQKCKSRAGRNVNKSCILSKLRRRKTLFGTKTPPPFHAERRGISSMHDTYLYTSFVSIRTTSISIVSPFRQMSKIMMSPTARLFLMSLTSSVVVTG